MLYLIKYGSQLIALVSGDYESHGHCDPLAIARNVQASVN